MKRVFENSCINGCAIYLVVLVVLVVLSAVGLGQLSARFGAGTTAPQAAPSTQDGQASQGAQGTVVAEPAAPARPGSAPAPQEAATPGTQAQAQSQGQQQGFPLFGIRIGGSQPAATPLEPAAAPPQPAAPFIPTPTPLPPLPVAAPPPVDSSYAPTSKAQGGEISGQATQPFYIVQPGDTLSGIAAHFTTTVEALRAANALSGDNTIWPGQLLYLPSGAPAPQPQPQPQAVPQEQGQGQTAPAGTGSGALPSMPNTGVNSDR